MDNFIGGVDESKWVFNSHNLIKVLSKFNSRSSNSAAKI